jgi:hypothetical protein
MWTWIQETHKDKVPSFIPSYIFFDHARLLHNALKKRSSKLLEFLGEVVDFNNSQMQGCCELIVHNLHYLLLTLTGSFSLSLSDDDLDLVLVEMAKFMVPF